MIKNLKRKIREEGVINVGIMITACLTIIGALISVIYTNASQRINVLESKSDVYAMDIAALKSDVSWIREALEAKGFHPQIERPSSLASTTLTNAN